jgi:hypothetical protein
MKSHPTLPMRNTLYRSQVVEKGGGASAYTSFAFNAYISEIGNTSMMLTDGQFELQVLELNNISDKNHVRTLLDLDVTVDADTAGGEQELLQSTAVNWNNDEDTYYALRLGDDGTGFGNGVTPGYFSNGNAFLLSQAANLAAFNSSADVVVRNLVDGEVTLGTGHPARRSGYTSNNITWTFRVTHSIPVWIALDIS